MNITLTTDDIKIKRKVGRPRKSDAKDRQMVSFSLKKNVIVELNKLTELFNRKAGLSFSRTKMLEAIILNEVRNFEANIGQYLSQ